MVAGRARDGVTAPLVARCPGRHRLHRSAGRLRVHAAWLEMFPASVVVGRRSGSGVARLSSSLLVAAVFTRSCQEGEGQGERKAKARARVERAERLLRNPCGSGDIRGSRELSAPCRLTGELVLRKSAFAASLHTFSLSLSPPAAPSLASGVVAVCSARCAVTRLRGSRFLSVFPTEVTLQLPDVRFGADTTCVQVS